MTTTDPRHPGILEAWEAVFATARVGLVLVDTEGRIARGNPAACALLGRACLGVEASALGLPPDIVEPVVIELSTATGERHVEVIPMALAGEGSELTVMMIRDMSALSRSEEALEEAQAIARIGSWRYDVARDRPEWSRQMYALFNRDPTLPAPAWKEHQAHVHPDDWDELDELVVSSMQEGTPYRKICRVIQDDGTVRWRETIGRAARGADGAIVTLMGTVQDVTERVEAETRRRALEEQLLQAQKMEAVGMLAGGIAHDFNNLLTVILGYTSLGVRQCRGNPKLTATLERIQQAGQTSSELVQQLLAFSRKQLLQPQHLVIDERVAAMTEMLERLLREEITLAKRLHAEGWTVEADPAQLEQVVMNLVVNAVDAIPEAGTVTIESHVVQLGPADERLDPTMEPGPYLELEVHDTGGGMDETTLGRLFEPFFTTKGQGRGTGLGLSTVYGIVTQSGGSLRVESTLGQGSTFSLYLPASRIVDEDAGREEPARGHVGGETILVVEDQEALRELVGSLLEEEGYSAILAQDGDEALTALETHGEAISLVLTDVVMPRMSGPELVAVLQVRWPTIPYLFMSGYSEEMVTERGGIIQQTLLKPFTAEQLSRAVGEALEGASSSSPSPA